MFNNSRQIILKSNIILEQEKVQHSTSNHIWKKKKITRDVTIAYFEFEYIDFYQFRIWLICLDYSSLCTMKIIFKNVNEHYGLLNIVLFEQKYE